MYMRQANDFRIIWILQGMLLDVIYSTTYCGQILVNLVSLQNLPCHFAIGKAFAEENLYFL